MEGALDCEDCGMSLRATPSLAALQSARESVVREAALWGSALLLMLVVNAAVFGGAGYVVALAPIVLFGRALYRWRKLNYTRRKLTARGVR